MHFLSPEAYPGDRVFYRLSAQQGSLCAIGMVDRSVYLVQANNNFNEEQVTWWWNVMRDFCIY